MTTEEIPMPTESRSPSPEIVAELGNALARLREFRDERSVGLKSPFTLSEMMAHEKQHPPGEEEMRIEGRISEIGRQLLGEGGESLMLEVCYAVQEQFGERAMSRLDYAWTGIGNWVA
jgi:hypothetical protein